MNESDSAFSSQHVRFAEEASWPRFCAMGPAYEQKSSVDLRFCKFGDACDVYPAKTLQTFWQKFVGCLLYSCSTASFFGLLANCKAKGPDISRLMQLMRLQEACQAAIESAVHREQDAGLLIQMLTNRWKLGGKGAEVLMSAQYYTQTSYNMIYIMLMVIHYTYLYKPFMLDPLTPQALTWLARTFSVL